MYKEFYGLTSYPFALTPDPQFLYLSENHENCLFYLLSGLERDHGIMVLTGEMGTGKTLLLNILIQRLGETTRVAFLVHSKLDSTQLLQYMSQEFNLEVSRMSKGELLSNLKNFLLSYSNKEEKFLLIVDEAQNLSIDVLEDLRLLANFETHEKKLIQIILSGQPSLEEKLKTLELSQLRQRIGINCRLTSMKYDETENYIKKRLSVAEAKYPLFTSSAIYSIFTYSKGVPRVINLMCDLALFFGSIDKEREIDHTMIQRVAENLNLYAPEKPVVHYTRQQRDANEAHASDSALALDTRWPELSAAFPSRESTKQFERQPRQRGLRRPGRLALIIGLIVCSLLGVGVLLSLLDSGKLTGHTTSTLPEALAPSPQSPLHSDPPKKVQWAQTNVAYQLSVGEPFTVPLPQLHNTPDGAAVTVTLEASNDIRTWLKFDPEKLLLSGTPPPTGIGQTYYLTLRAHTADGLESPLQLAVTLSAPTSPTLTPPPMALQPAPPLTPLEEKCLLEKLKGKPCDNN